MEGVQSTSRGTKRAVNVSFRFMTLLFKATAQTCLHLKNDDLNDVDEPGTKGRRVIVNNGMTGVEFNDKELQKAQAKNSELLKKIQALEVKAARDQDSLATTAKTVKTSQALIQQLEETIKKLEAQQSVERASTSDLKAELTSTKEEKLKYQLLYEKLSKGKEKTQWIFGSKSSPELTVPDFLQETLSEANHTIESLTKQRETLEAANLFMEAEIEEFKTKETLSTGQINHWKQRFAEVEREQNLTKQRNDNLKDEVRKLSSENTDIKDKSRVSLLEESAKTERLQALLTQHQLEIHNLNASTARLEAERKALKARISQSENDRPNLDQQMETDRLKEAEARLKAQNSTLKAELSTARQKETGHESDIRQLGAERDKLKAAIRLMEDNQTHLSEQLNLLQQTASQEKSNLEGKIESLENDLRKFQAKLEQREAQLNQSEEDLKQSDADLKQSFIDDSERKKTYLKELDRLAAKEQEANREYRALRKEKDRLQSDYDQLLRDQDDEQSLRQEIDELKEKNRQLQTQNADAIQATKTQEEIFKVWYESTTNSPF
ncbi:hypothetical protein VKT23_014052 [Stygiomarasmius scandens]|uniref:Uncharacterized protein n=1 Tax=Marasmiellus scandens TaxID=2682957 RepID=A0ABR1J5T9_9AGAR